MLAETTPIRCINYLVATCWLTQCRISYVMKRIDALIWTPSMDDCLQALEQSPEWEGDELLVALVKIQLIVEQLTRAVWQSADNTPPPFFASALRTQLVDLKNQFPIHIQENRLSTPAAPTWLIFQL